MRRVVSTGMVGPSSPRRLFLASIAGVTVALAYAILLAFFVATEPPSESTFDAPAGGAAGVPVTAYVDLLAIDTVRNTADVRIDLATGSDAGGPAYHGIVRRDVALRVSDGFATDEIRFRRGESASAHAFAAGIDGSSAGYPFDRYAMRITVRADAANGASAAVAVPVRLTAFTGIPEWRVRVVRAAADRGDERSLAFEIARPPLLVFFACVIYCVVATIGVSAVSIAALIAARRRRFESLFVTAIVGMSFTIPSLRNILPGAPPIGVVADAAIVLSAEVAVAISLATIVALWLLRGPGEA